MSITFGLLGNVLEKSVAGSSSSSGSSVLRALGGGLLASDPALIQDLTANLGEAAGNVNALSQLAGTLGDSSGQGAQAFGGELSIPSSNAQQQAFRSYSSLQSQNGNTPSASLADIIGGGIADTDASA